MLFALRKNLHKKLEILKDINYWHESAFGSFNYKKFCYQYWLSNHNFCLANVQIQQDINTHPHTGFRITQGVFLHLVFFYILSEKD